MTPRLREIRHVEIHATAGGEHGRPEGPRQDGREEPRPAGRIDDLLARCSFPTPDDGPVTCAVSGGADSLALLVLATSAGLDVTAMHVDHGLRPGSASEADVVAAAARRFGARFAAARVELPPGPNLEERARDARYRELPDRVLTGHTADDQAETILLNVLRGSGLDGLAGMRRRSPTGPRRPLLGLRRSETSALCRELGLDPVVDPSNLDPVHRRTRVRHELMPLAGAIAERDVAAVIARQADVVRDDLDLLDSLASALDPTDARALTGAPVALARRAVRRWLATAVDGRPPDLACVERVLAVGQGRHVACDVRDGWRVERHAQRLSLIRPGPG